MTKLLFSITVFLSFLSLKSQHYDKLNLNIVKLEQYSTSVGDYDNDNDPDILISGLKSGITGVLDSTSFITYVIKNMGNNEFVTLDIKLPGILDGSALWYDYDNDDDLDFILTGVNNEWKTCLFENRGEDEFVEINNSFIGVNHGCAAIGDYDNDGDKDVFITGEDISLIKQSKLYRNDSIGYFTEVSTDIGGITNSSADWGDYDNDGDLDLIITGDEFENKTELYMNMGNDSLVAVDTQIDGVFNGIISWGDFDHDADLDILISGMHGNLVNYNGVTKVYENIDNAFSEISLAIPEQTCTTEIELNNSVWVDIDNDYDLDIVSNEFIYSYGNNTYNKQTDFHEYNLVSYKNGISYGDFNKDGKTDLVIGSSVLIYDTESQIPEIISEESDALNIYFQENHLIINSKYSLEDAMKISLIDINGKIVYSNISSNETHIITLDSKIPYGLYILKISNSEFNFSKKIIISSHYQP